MTTSIPFPKEQLGPTLLYRSVIFTLVLLSFQSFAIQSKPDSESLPTTYNYQVPYSAIAALPFNDSSETLYYGKDKLQFLKKWPAIVESSEERKGTVIFVHGGCWLNAFDYSHGKGFLTALSNNGFDAWAIEYRRTGDPGGGWPGTYEDVKQGINYLLEKIEGPVFLLGHSAGGHLAALYGTEQSDKKIQTIVGLGAITDIVRYSQGTNSCQSATPKFMKGTLDAREKDYKSATLVGKTLKINTILLHGKEDKIVPYQQSELAGSTARLIEKAGHFDWIYPKSKGFSLLLEILNDQE